MAHTAKVLTIAVAAYNVAPYIGQCLDSFVDENLLPALDIVVIDDGSTDATAHIVKKYINRFPESFRLVSQENGGYGAAVNHALALAQGEYFKTVDGDDWVDTKELLTVVCYLMDNRERSDVVVTDYCWVRHRDGKEIRRIKTDFAQKQYQHIYSFDEIADKVYLNKEWEWGYRENEELDGYDPYSNSKSCSELVTHSYINSFFKNMNIAVSTARAGNVIGGGDFASDRIIPDCIRAAIKHEDIVVRNPFSTRPYQHVLEPIYAYLMIAQKQYEDIKYAGYYNVGPDDRDCFQTGALVDLFVKHWGEGMKWIDKYDGGPHEANFLKLDCSKLKKTFGWQPHWDLNIAIEKVVEWSKCWLTNGDIEKCMNKQIEEFMKVGK